MKNSTGTKNADIKFWPNASWDPLSLTFVPY